VPTRVLLLRHAESATPHVFLGAESDVGLSDRGRRQAEAVAPHVAACRPDVLISSGMRRALETAEPIARACNLAVAIERDLHERRVGALTGQPMDRDGVWAETVRRWLAGETNYASPGAESFDAVKGRVLPVWQRLTTEHAGRTVAVVAHGHVCRVLLLSLLAGYSVVDWPRIGPIRNVAINELLGDNSAWQAVRINDVVFRLPDE
jgi:2,3-bisphosphoglycerate-dependent phosphoglycerate mutase